MRSSFVPTRPVIGLRINTRLIPRTRRVGSIKERFSRGRYRAALCDSVKTLSSDTSGRRSSGLKPELARNPLARRAACPPRRASAGDRPSSGAPPVLAYLGYQVRQYLLAEVGEDWRTPDDGRSPAEALLGGHAAVERGGCGPARLQPARSPPARVGAQGRDRVARRGPVTAARKPFLDAPDSPRSGYESCVVLVR